MTYGLEKQQTGPESPVSTIQGQWSLYPAWNRLRLPLPFDFGPPAFCNRFWRFYGPVFYLGSISTISFSPMCGKAPPYERGRIGRLPGKLPLVCRTRTIWP